MMTKFHTSMYDHKQPKALLLFKAHGNKLANEGNVGYGDQEFIEVLKSCLDNLFLLTYLCL